MVGAISELQAAVLLVRTVRRNSTATMLAGLWASEVCSTHAPSTRPVSVWEIVVGITTPLFNNILESGVDTRRLLAAG